jgi:hypothetical protein
MSEKDDGKSAQQARTGSDLNANVMTSMVKKKENFVSE